jgi:branched-chain amino acid transport system ATP-binding protein
MTGDALLVVQDLTRRFGGLTAVQGLNFEVRRGEILGLIGPNGAGKSTTFNVISGFYRPSAGRVSFDGVDISRRRPDQISRLGLVRTFQHGSLLHDMTVHDNILVATISLLPSRADRLQRVHETAALLGLSEVLHERAGFLPHGLQRMVSIAIALAQRSRLLCLDEPLTGLNQSEVANALGCVPPHPRRLRQHAAAGGTQHEGGDGDLRPHRRAGPWRVPGRRPARGDQPQRSGDRRLPGAQGMSASLVVSGLVVRYGPVPAVDGVDFQLEKGRIATIVGSNGAGKSTIMKALAGLVKPHAGRVQLFGDDVTGQEPDALVRRGLSLVPEGRRLFTAMSVGDNLQAGAYSRSDKAAIAADLDRVLTHFPALARPAQGAGRQPQWRAAADGGGGARADVGTAPAAAGRTDHRPVAPAIVDTIAGILRDIAAGGVDVLLVEQNAEMALALADQAFILERGRIVMAGAAAELARSDEVRRAYLGI